MNWPAFITFSACAGFLLYAFGWQVTLAYFLGMVALKALLYEVRG